jgi:hypothetical protein
MPIPGQPLDGVAFVGRKPQMRTRLCHRRDIIEKMLLGVGLCRGERAKVEPDAGGLHEGLLDIVLSTNLGMKSSASDKLSLNSLHRPEFMEIFRR